MMQTAEPGHGYDLATGTGILCCRTTGGRSLRQREMHPVIVIVADVIVHRALQMPFIENDHMVEQIAAAVAGPSFGNAVFPQTAEAGPLGLDAELKPARCQRTTVSGWTRTNDCFHSGQSRLKITQNNLSGAGSLG